MMVAVKIAEPFVMPLGKSRTPVLQVLHNDWRTAKQFETVRRISQRSDFDHGCMSIFGPKPTNVHKPYRGPVVFLWRDKIGGQHGTKIDGSGKIVHSCVATTKNGKTTCIAETIQ